MRASEIFIARLCATLCIAVAAIFAIGLVVTEDVAHSQVAGDREWGWRPAECVVIVSEATGVPPDADGIRRVRVSTFNVYGLGIWDGGTLTYSRDLTPAVKIRGGWAPGEWISFVCVENPPPPEVDPEP